jgi:methylenetetrahydrofolate reductase (NADPH)
MASRPQVDRTMADTTTSAPGAPHQAQLKALLSGFSIEASSGDAAIEAAASHLASGSDVYVNWLPDDNHHRSVAACATLRRAGLNPVPHVAARYLTGLTQLQDFLARLAGEAGVQQVLAIAGDRDRPVGPFDSSLQLLETGLFERYRIAKVGLAGYPEGNPRIATQALATALSLKLARAAEGGLSPYIVTQFCFEAQPIIDWTRRLRGEGVTAPVHVGLAGPAGLATLMKFALRCGVGNSIRALSLRGPAIARLLTEAGPERVIEDLARASAADPALALAGVHFFSFGGFVRTAAWVREYSQAASA